MDTPGFAQELEERLEEVHHQARGPLKLSGEAMTRGYDLRTSHIIYKEGDQVWLYKPQEEEGTVTQVMPESPVRM